ncbi:Lmo0850 family protein [Bacillus sp. REN10]|nr:Lmo0850 family protein [Bacillus sp. REN10]
MSNNQRVLKIIDRLSMLGIKVSKTKSRLEVYRSLKQVIYVKP